MIYGFLYGMSWVGNFEYLFSLVIFACFEYLFAIVGCIR